MKTLVKKLKNKKGFTLMEMLIVVAIMVILVAVSIPVFSSQLNEAKEAADAANARAAKAAALTLFLMGDGTRPAGTTGDFIYDANAGTLKAASGSGAVAGYGKSTSADSNASTNDVPNGRVIQITISSTGTVTYKWITAPTS